MKGHEMRAILILFLLVFNYHLFAQNPEWINYTNCGFVNSIAIEGENIWIGTQSGGLVMFDKATGNTTSYITFNSDMPDNTVGAIAIDSNNNKWIACGGLTMFDDNNWAVYNTSNSGLPSPYISAIKIDSNDNKWIGTADAGLVMFDGSNWTVYETSNSDLPCNYINAMIIDSITF